MGAKSTKCLNMCRNFSPNQEEVILKIKQNNFIAQDKQFFKFWSPNLGQTSFAVYRI